MRLPYPEAGEVIYGPVVGRNPTCQSWVQRGALPGTLGESLGLYFSICAAEMSFSWLFDVCFQSVCARTLVPSVVDLA